MHNNRSNIAEMAGYRIGYQGHIIILLCESFGLQHGMPKPQLV